MTTPDIESTKQHLVDLNQQIGAKEQEDATATNFFEELLSNQLILCRASGMFVGKSEPEGFLNSLEKPRPFISRVSEDISMATMR